jgi:hypothetical protein
MSRELAETVAGEAPERLGSVESGAGQRPGAARAEAARANWRTLLAGASPREVLARLLAGDPLGLRGRVALALGDHGYVFDPDRVLLRVAARVARFSARYRGQPELDTWLRGNIDEALLELVEDDREGADAGAASSLAVLAQPLGLTAQTLHRATIALHTRTLEERRAFRRLVLEVAELDATARELGTSPTEAARAARRALEAVLAVAEEVAP